MIKKKHPTIDGYEHVHRIWSSEFEMYSAKVAPGEFYITDQVECIKTTLGSCIACCVWDHKNGLGGMNHFMLPEFNTSKGAVKNASDLGKEGCWAMEFLINGVLLNGGERRNLEVKVFGGAQLIASLAGAKIGQKNIHFIEDYLQKESLKIVSKDLGGELGRTIVFFPKTGKVKLNRLAHSQDKRIIQEENSYAGRVNDRADQSGEIELF